MEMILRAAHLSKAQRLVRVSFAHIDACFYNGTVHPDFVRYLLAHDARLQIPTWTNSGLVSLAQRSVRSNWTDSRAYDEARELMQLYEQLGCKPGMDLRAPSVTGKTQDRRSYRQL